MREFFELINEYPITSLLETIAKISCNLADNLINELKKGSHGKGRI